MIQQKKIHLLIVDDQEIVLAGLKSLFADTEIMVVAEATTGQAAVKYVLANEVDLVLMDVCMPEGDGLTALGRIKLDKPQLPIVMFSAFDNPTYVAREVALGAAGYLSKNANHEALLAAVRMAATGENTWTRDELRRIHGALATPRLTADIESALTQREGEVLRQLACGLTNKQIAETLNISYETVKEHVPHLLRKLGVSDRTQAAVWAVRKELI